MPNHDEIKVKRSKKSDKEKKNQELNGKFSAKHVRQMEALQEKRAVLKYVEQK